MCICTICSAITTVITCRRRRTCDLLNTYLRCSRVRREPCRCTRARTASHYGRRNRHEDESPWKIPYFHISLSSVDKYWMCVTRVCISTVFFFFFPFTRPNRCVHAAKSAFKVHLRYYCDMNKL